MPIIKSAKKALRQTKKRARENLAKKLLLKRQILKVKKERKPELFVELCRLADKAVKSGVIHKNKAARIKKAAGKLVAKSAAVVKKMTAKKTTSKK